MPPSSMLIPNRQAGWSLPQWHPLADIFPPLPLVITWVDDPARVDALLPTICGMVQDGLVTVEDVVIAKALPGAQSA